MPETTVHKDCQAKAGEGDVRSSGKVRPMNAKAKAAAMERAAKRNLRCRVSPWKALHEAPHHVVFGLRTLAADRPHRGGAS